MNKVLSLDTIVEIYRLSEQEGLSQRQIGKLLGIGKSTVGDVLREETHKELLSMLNDKPIASGTIKPPKEKVKKFEGSCFVFTSAQNNTFVHDKFLRSLEVYCKHNNAQLVVSTFSYNKNMFLNEKDSQWYDPKIRKYIINEPMNITDSLTYCGELDIIPTAVNPLSGFHNYTGLMSAIIPHAKLQLESIPTPKYDEPKLMYTTGAVTQRNYLSRKAGQKAQHHHVFGALVVEVDADGDWFVRQLNCESETGEFYDLENKYTPTGVVSGDSTVEAINWGDIHAIQLEPVVAKTSWLGNGNILDTLKPKHQFIHDVLDQRARNHHSIKDPHFMFNMYVNETESVKAEVELTAKVILDMQRDFSEVIVVESNHDLALDRYLKEQDYRKDPVNAIFFLELQLAKYRAIYNGDKNFSTFEHACHLTVPETKYIRYLRTDESFRICNNEIECGQHGSIGASGTRGSVNSFQKQGMKFNIGHSHSATIKDGVYQAGVSGKLDQNYNVGGSSWSHSHIVTYINGKRTIVTLKNGKWRG